MTRPIDKVRHYAGGVILTLLPIAALFGNAPADIALVLTIVVFVTTSENVLQTLKQSRFIQLSVVFWLWILLCSAVSLFPKHSFQDSLPWIRFPLYAFAISYLLNQKSGRMMHLFIWACAIGTLIETVFLFNEYFFMPKLSGQDNARLYGTFSRQMPGWYIVCFGIIVILTQLQKLWHTNFEHPYRNIIIIFFIITTFAMFITGEVMNTAAYTSIVILFFVCRPIRNLPNLLVTISVIGCLISILFAIIWLDPGLHNRFIVSASKRLPWISTSDYYLPWSMGLKIGLENPLFGVGAKNFNLYCLSLKNEGVLEFKLNFLECQWHPHNLYLQVFSETGVIGLFLFFLIISYILILAFKTSIILKWRDNTALIIAFVVLFPIQTYSQAFGQSKNFFFWTMIGFILAKIQLSLELKK